MVLPFRLKTAKDWLSKTLARFLVASGKNSEPENEFQTLTPIVDPDKDGYQPYFKALDYALNRDDVKNIAITGPYGAGKSSVILSYLKKVSVRKSLSYKIGCLLRREKPKKVDDHVIISLANFETDETLKNSESLSKEQSIEYSILQQILYKVDKGTLPDSRVERIHTRNGWQILKTSFLLFFILTLAVLVTTLLLPQKIISTFSLSPLGDDFIAIYPLWRWGFIAVFSFIICWYCLSRFYRIGFFDRKIALDKVNLLKAEIAAEKQNTASLLNLYIDEIVYFFLKTKYRIVVFEDLDRLNNGHIFIKLREINQIVNNSKLLEMKPIKFIFAVREDLLKDAESQTKFFDFIVPVIPAVDSENAYDILNAKVKVFNAHDKEYFFKKISLYLTDMRVMNNIINEFNLFKNLITGELSDKKLFSLIMYKNLCTKDFTQIDNQNGFLYKIVDAYSKRQLHDLYFLEFEETLSSLKTRMEQARTELHNSEKNLRDELLRRYLPEIYVIKARFYSYTNQYNHSNESWAYSELVEHESLFVNFLQRKFESGVVMVNNRNGNYEQHYDISSDKRNELLREYEKRTPIVLDNNQKTLESISKKILDMQHVNNLKRSIPLHVLCEKITLAKLRNWVLSDAPTEHERKQNIINASIINFNIELLFFMLSNGYIEQDYMQYRSIFHAGALSKSDNLYIQKVAAKVNFDELKDIHLNNIPNIIDKMESLSFKYNEGILHPDIISHLINHKVEFSQDVFVHLFNHGSHELISRVMWTYYCQFSNDDYHDLINSILSNDNTLSKLMAAADYCCEINTDDKSHEQLHASFIRFGKIENLVKQSAIQDYLLELQADTLVFKYIQPDEIESFSRKLKKFNVVFDKIHEINGESELVLLKFVAENYLYAFTLDNLTALFNVYSDTRKSTEEISRNPYSLIMGENIACLTNAINKNSAVFIAEYFIHSKENVNTITSLLNSDISEHSKEIIIESMQFEVQQLSKIKNIKLCVIDEVSHSIYDLLFKKRRVAANWENIFDYMHAGADDEILWAFVDAHSVVLSGHEVRVPDESVDNVVNYIISAVDKPDRLYAQLISVLPVSIDHTISELPLQKFKVLCANNRIFLSKMLYEEVLTIYEGQRRKGLDECLSLIIKQNISVFEDDIDYYLKDGDEFDNELIELVLNDNDISLITKVSIIDIIWPYYSDTFFAHISLNSQINFELLLKVTKDDTRLVFLNYLFELDELSHEDINRALRSFVSEQYNLIADNAKRAKILKKESNETLLKHLAQCHFISSYRDDGKYFKVYHHRQALLNK